MPTPLRVRFASRVHLGFTSTQRSLYLEFTSISLRCHCDVTSISLRFAFDLSHFDSSANSLRFHSGFPPSSLQGEGEVVAYEMAMGTAFLAKRTRTGASFLQWGYSSHPGSDRPTHAQKGSDLLATFGLPKSRSYSPNLRHTTYLFVFV